MKMCRRMLFLGAMAGAQALLLPHAFVSAQEPAAAVQANEEQLGQMLAALGLKPEKKEQRYDFHFIAQMEKDEWSLSMSAVLSQDKESVWLMAWLDPLPDSSADVPRTALLRMLSQNDQLGGGKFFAYIPNNRRFVLERVIPNENLTSAQLRSELQDLGTSVVETYPLWNVANWNPSGIPAAPVGGAASQTTGTPSQSALNESKFESPVRR